MKTDIKKLLKEGLENGNKALITPEYYIGKDEIYTELFVCPKCSKRNIIHDTNYCRYCGIQIVLSDAVKRDVFKRP